jgi:hypothetical protein
MEKSDCAVTVFGTKDEYRLDHKNTKNTAFPYVMSNLPAEIEYIILSDVLNSCWEMLGYKSCLVCLILLHQLRSYIYFISAEIVCMNIVIFCTEKCTLIYVGGESWF